MAQASGHLQRRIAHEVVVPPLPWDAAPLVNRPDVSSGRTGLRNEIACMDFLMCRPAAMPPAH